MKERDSFFLIILLLLPFSAYTLTLSLYKEVGVNEPNVYLNKIGRLHLDQADPHYVNIEKMTLMNIPFKNTFVSADQISTMIKKKYGIPLRVLGKGIHLYPLYTSILEQEIIEKIKTQLKSMYPELCQIDTEIVFLKRVKFPKIPAGDIRYKFIIPGGRIDLVKYVRIEVIQDDQDIINIAYPMRIVFKIPSWKSKYNLPKGSVLKRDQLVFSLTNSFSFPKLSSIADQVVGKTLLKSVKANNLITHTMISQ